ncbi:unnamed protein product [Amoebophrya sp. A25]|nr:unnamed protein product [Amoebophrya sp. A25]|eukprot:GSA25T00020256001.1
MCADPAFDILEDEVDEPQDKSPEPKFKLTVFGGNTSASIRPTSQQPQEPRVNSKPTPARNHMKPEGDAEAVQITDTKPKEDREDKSGVGVEETPAFVLKPLIEAPALVLKPLGGSSEIVDKNQNVTEYPHGTTMGLSPPRPAKVRSAPPSSQRRPRQVEPMYFLTDPAGIPVHDEEPSTAAETHRTVHLPELAELASKCGTSEQALEFEPPSFGASMFASSSSSQQAAFEEGETTGQTGLESYFPPTSSSVAAEVLASCPFAGLLRELAQPRDTSMAIEQAQANKDSALLLDNADNIAAAGSLTPFAATPGMDESYFMQTQASCWAAGLKSFNPLLEADQLQLAAGALTPAEPESVLAQAGPPVISNLTSSSSSSTANNKGQEDNQDTRQEVTPPRQLALTAALNSETDEITFDQKAFAHVHIHGQFNLGFILGSFRDELFIFDQHACDEKRRFELLNRSSKVEMQMLINPLLLQLSPAQEQTIANYIHVFRQNGFDLVYNEDRPPGERCSALALPSTKGLLFGEKDIEDLINVIDEDNMCADIDRTRNDRRNGGVDSFVCEDVGTDELESVTATALVAASSVMLGTVSSSNPSRGITDPGPGGLLNIYSHRSYWGAVSNIPRPKKVWQLLASRACRSAIMIGKSLTIKEMENIVAQLAALAQPWNCPHGRPTLRHLVRTRDVCRYEDCSLMKS